MPAARRTPTNLSLTGSRTGPQDRGLRPLRHRDLAGAGIFALALTLTACDTGEEQAADTQTEDEADVPEGENEGDEDGADSEDGADGDAEEAADLDEADDKAEGEDGDEALNPHFTENEVFSWNLPEGWTAENEVTHEEPWPNDEVEQTVQFVNAEGEEVTSASINLATDNDGPPPADVELVEAEPIPEAEQPGSETYVRSSLVSDCTEDQDIGDPQSECGYFLSFSLVSLEEGEDIEDTQDVWVFRHEVEGEDHGGNVLMGARLPADATAEDETTTLPYEEAQELADSEDYQDLWELFSSFGHHTDGSAQ